MLTRLRSEIANNAGSLAGVTLFALSFRWFLVPANLYSGGVTGLAQLVTLMLVEVIGMRVPQNIDVTGIIFWLINVPLFLLGLGSIGRKFFIRTVVAVTVQSLLVTMIPTPQAPIFQDLLLNCLIGGAMSGFGVGLTLRSGSSGGGVDILGMYLAKKYPEFGVGKIAVFINVFIFTISAVLFNWEVAAYSTVFAIVSGLMIDRTHDQNIKVSILIISRKKDLGRVINAEIRRGVTSWSGWGEYSQTDSQIHMAVVNKYEMRRMIRFIRQQDPEAFIEVSSPDMIIGNFEQRLEVN